MVEVLLRPVADAFLQVGVFVAVMAAAAAWVRWRYGDRLSAVVARRRALGPLLGALLGITPGCAVELMLVTLFLRGSVSFGTVVAALTATMGDAAWLIIAADPSTALWMHAVLAVTGLVTGYTVDALGIRPPLRTPTDAPAEPVPLPALVPAGGAALALPGAPRTPLPGVPLLRAVGAPAAGTLVLAVLGSFLAVPAAFQLLDPAALTGALHGVDPTLLLGTAGTLAAAGVVVHARVAPAPAPAGLPAMLRDSVLDTSRIVLWVAAIFTGWTVVELATGFDGSQLPMAGMLGVLAGALIGLVPGCAVQITFAGLYLAGAVPAPALLANAVSQDGDALIPMIAGDRAAALLTTALTTVPAVIAGGAALLVL